MAIKKANIALLLSVALIIGLLAACGGSSTGGATTTAATTAAATTTSAEAATEATTTSVAATTAAATDTAEAEEDDDEKDAYLRVFYTKGGFEQPPTSPDSIQLKIMEDTGINFEFMYSANATEELAAMLASGDYPDIAGRLLYDPFTYYDEGVLLDLMPYMDLMPNITGLIPQRAMDFYKVNGEQIAIPKWTTTKRYNLIIRGDWLKKLNLEAPVTLDDMYTVGRAFVDNDPDGNGKDDTYAISGLGLDSFDYIFGAFGCIMGETSWNAENTHCNIYFKDVGGVLTPYAILPEMKEALTLLNQWYMDGLIDPEYVSHNSAIWTEKYEQSRFGITTHWWNWEAQRDAAMIDAIPEVESLRIAPPIGPGGLSGLRAVPEVVSSVIVFKNTKYPKSCARFLDYFHDEEGGMLTSYTGVEGLHWEKTPDGRYVTLPQFDVDNKWIQWYFLFENEQPLYKVETYLAPSRRGALEWNVVRDDADGMNPPALLQYKADLTALCAEVMNDMITGKVPLSDFDKFTEDFMKSGGQEWTDQVNELYAAR